VIVRLALRTAFANRAFVSRGAAGPAALRSSGHQGSRLYSGRKRSL